MTLKDLRMRKKLTQDALATAIGVKRTTVSMWESGGAYPRVEKLFLLSKHLGCEPQDVINALKEKPEN